MTGLWTDAPALLLKRDEDGRPLGEGAAGITPRRGACPYTDGRQGAPMNLDALDQVRACWTDICALLGAAAADEAPTVLGAWRATSRCLALAAWAPEPVPRAWSATWKTTLGYHQVFTLLILENDLGDVPLASLGTGAQFAAWCARERLLHGQVEVCGGSPAWIARAFDVLVDRQGSGFPADRSEGDRFMQRIADDLRARQEAFLAGTPEPRGALSWQVDGRPFGVAAVDRLVPSRS
jgi:hypothetical protein